MCNESLPSLSLLIKGQDALSLIANELHKGGYKPIMFPIHTERINYSHYLLPLKLNGI